MACPAFPSNQTEERVYLPVRGQCVSAYLTCPGCGNVLIAHRLNRTQGVKRCGECDQVIMIGLTAFLLPSGPHSTPSDYALPPQSDPLQCARQRTRKRRVKALRELSLADPMPTIALERYSAGMAINRVVLVPAPQPESVSADQAESSNPTNPASE